MQSEKYKELLGNIFKGSGYGFSKKVMISDTENKTKSRRVSFKVVLKETK
jgi:outer membrane protein OmpA-like peptidoglycan-associated protein